MPSPRKYANAHERRRAALQRRRERDGVKPKPAPVPVRLSSSEAIELYRLEKAKSAQRNAGKVAAVTASIRAALDRADAERTAERRGGRPRRLPGMALTSDPANALVNALTRGE